MNTNKSVRVSLFGKSAVLLSVFGVVAAATMMWVGFAHADSGSRNLSRHDSSRQSVSSTTPSVGRESSHEHNLLSTTTPQVLPKEDTGRSATSIFEADTEDDND